jgi:single-strand DNA-binding protein
MFNRSVNKVVLVGNVGKDPEVRYMPNGDAVCNFSIASTEWHNCTVYRKFGEMMGQHLKKGAKVYVEGKLKTRKWQDKTTGQDKYATDVIVSEAQLMDSKNDSQQTAPQQYNNAPQQYNNAPQQYNNAPQQYNNAPQQKAPAPQQGAQDFDDDIPF